MNPIILELTQEERAVVVKHLEGLRDLYQHINNSGSGPLIRLIDGIKRKQLPLKCNEQDVDELLRHIGGASKYNATAHGSDPLHFIVKKIEQVRLGGGYIL